MQNDESQHVWARKRGPGLALACVSVAKSRTCAGGPRGRADLDRNYVGGIARGGRNPSLVNICRTAPAHRSLYAIPIVLASGNIARIDHSRL